MLLNRANGNESLYELSTFNNIACFVNDFFNRFGFDFNHILGQFIAFSFCILALFLFVSQQIHTHTTYREDVFLYLPY